MNIDPRNHAHPRRLALAVLAALLVSLLCLPLQPGAQAPELDYGEPPPQWGGSGAGYWGRSEEYISTGRAGYISRLTSGEMVEFPGGETIVTNASLGVDWMAEELRDGFGERWSKSIQCEPLEYDKPLAPQVTVTDGQFHGYPTTVVQGYCRHPSYAYQTETCDVDGNCVPDTSSGVQENWEGGFTYMARLTCIETTPGGPCTMLVEEISAMTEGPAALGEHVEEATFEALLAEVDAWKDRWSFTGQEPAEPPPPPPPGERTITIQGTVTVKDPISKQVMPIIEAPITLQRGSDVLDFAFTKPPDGNFELKVPVTDSLVLSTTLLHAVSVPSTFRVVYDQADPTIWIATTPFHLDENTPDTLVKQIDFSTPGDLVSGPVVVPPDRIDDVGLIYHYAREAWQMAAILLGVEFDLPTLKIKAFSTTPKAKDSAYWRGPMTGFAPIDPFVEISPKLSDFTNLDASGTVMHEFGHHVMADTYDNLLPNSPGDKNHEGFANPSTTDSWREGFATFFCLWTQKDQILKRSPQLWHNSGEVENMELNYLAWSSWEEYAVTSLLWDLIDPISAGDATEMPVANWATSPVVAKTGTTIRYGDHIEMERMELWRLLAASTLASNKRPGAAPQGYNYVFDVKQFYHTLIENGVGLTHAATPNGLDAVDELFIAHGFFADTNPQNLAWDLGEEVGATDHGPITVDKVSFPVRPSRRSPPPVANTYFNYQVRDAATGGTVDVIDFLVTVEFEPPYGEYNYSYTTRALAANQLQYSGPPSYYRATTSIAATGSGVESSSSLQFTNEEYWQMRAQQPTGPLLDHTFEVQLSGESSLDDTWSDGFEGDSSSVVPASSEDLFLPLLFCGVSGGILVIGAVVVIGVRSRKKRQAPSPSPSPVSAPRLAPIQTQRPRAPMSSCPHCGKAARPGVRFCIACGGSLAPATPPLTRRASPQPAQGAAGWQLLVVAGPGAGRRYPLGPNTSLGRSRDNSIRLDDTQSSGHHAVLLQISGGYVVQDLGSTNGTWVNGHRIRQTVAVKPGDRMQIGNTVLQVIGSGSPSAPSGSLVCQHCGQPAKKAGARFCGNCGGRL